MRGLAERRTDIFGVEETAIGKKVGEEPKGPQDDKVMWDGHSGSAESAQRKAQANITVDDQIEAIQKAHGLIEGKGIGPKTTETTISQPPTPVQPPQHRATQSVVQISQNPVQMVTPIRLQPVPQPQQVLTPVVMRPMINVVQRPQQVLVVQQPMAVQHVVQQQQQPTVVPSTQMMMQQNVQVMQQQRMEAMVEPPSKRQRTEANLIPEKEFLARSRGPVTFRVQCPNADKAEWNLNGQTLTFTLPLTDEVSVIKAKIHEATGMPGGKQKLQLEGLFIKDSNSLAFYNMQTGSLINLQVKERGGRKK